MRGTIRARTDNGDVVFNARTGKVCKGDFRGIERIDKLDVEATLRNIGGTLEQLKATGCRLTHCEFTLVKGGVRRATPYPFVKRGVENCEHDVTPAAGYGATTGVHSCCHCGATISWRRGKFVALPEVNDPFWSDVLWAVFIAAALSLVTALRNW